MDPTNPQSWNRYAYVTNNPVGRIDPLGLDDCSPGGGDNGGGDNGGGDNGGGSAGDGGGGDDGGGGGGGGDDGDRDEGANADWQVHHGSSGYWRGILGGGRRYGYGNLFRYGTFGMRPRRRHRWGFAHAFDQNSCSDPNSGTTQTISTYSHGTISLGVSVNVTAEAPLVNDIFTNNPDCPNCGSLWVSTNGDMNALTAVYVATPAILAAPAGIAVFSTAETYGIPAVAIEAWTITNWRAVTSAAGWLYNQYQCQIQGNC